MPQAVTLLQVHRERLRSVERRAHWEGIYGTRGEDELSWHQADPRLSERLIEAYTSPQSRIVDAGGGTSTLAGRLSAAGFQNLTVVDISQQALDRGRVRSGSAAKRARRVRADLLGKRRLGSFDLWHDRAVFHFLTRARDRAAYLGLLRRSLVPGGIVVVASFALDGPTRCSGLPVARYSPADLARAFGRDFELIQSKREVHQTPWGAGQPFSYAVLRYSPTKPSG